MDDIFNTYRQYHLMPITEVTLKLQEWLSSFSEEYYIAQRLKRRPQILRKLQRLSVRLSQLQDIGGCRIIVESNDIVDSLLEYIQSKLTRSKYFEIKKVTDYRESGRDESGYRAVHLIVERNKVTVEIQIRSKLQHYWAESIERTSVIYGYHIKELQGDKSVIDYFKATSDVFYEIEMGRKPSMNQINALDKLRDIADGIIRFEDSKNVLHSYVNENYIKAMIAKDARMKGNFHNWMLVFNWNTGNFENWSVIERNPEKANAVYIENEKRWKDKDGFEVVMIGSTDASTIRQTHSHYFGIENYDKILENVDESILNYKKRNELGDTERSILSNLSKKGYWGTKHKSSLDTLKNHYCKNPEGFDESIKNLSRFGYAIVDFQKGCISLNIKKKAQIENFI